MTMTLVCLSTLNSPALKPRGYIPGPYHSMQPYIIYIHFFQFLNLKFFLRQVEILSNQNPTIIHLSGIFLTRHFLQLHLTRRKMIYKKIRIFLKRANVTDCAAGCSVLIVRYRPRPLRSVIGSKYVCHRVCKVFWSAIRTSNDQSGQTQSLDAPLRNTLIVLFLERGWRLKNKRDYVRLIFFY